MKAKKIISLRRDIFNFPSYPILLFALYKMKIFCIFFQKNLVNSKKSSTFVQN